MKSIINSALAFVLALAVSNGKAIGSVSTFKDGHLTQCTEIKSGGPIVKLQITFGKGEACKGKGICKVEVGVSWVSNTDAGYDAAGRTLTLDVDFADVESNQPDQVPNLNARMFVLEEDYALSDEVCQKLGAPAGLVIPVGEYPIKTVGGRRVIIITGPWL